MFLEWIVGNKDIRAGDRNLNKKSLVEWQTGIDQILVAIRDEQRARRKRATSPSCAPRSKATVQTRRLINRIANGPHRHAFYEAMTGLRCNGCGTSLGLGHELRRDGASVTGRWSGGARGQGMAIRILPEDVCARCGAMALACWMARIGQQAHRSRRAGGSVGRRVVTVGRRPLIAQAWIGLVITVLASLVAAVCEAQA